MGKTAIDAHRVNAFLLEPERLKVVTDKKHPLYDPRVELPVNEQLVLSMMAAGWHGTMQVWKDGDQVVVLDGRQRTKAAVEANKRLKNAGREPLLVRVEVERSTEANLYGIQALLNEGRTTVSDMERANILTRLIAFGKTEEQAGAMLGLDKAQTRRTLALLDCDKRVQDAVEAKQIKPTAAARLSKLPREQQVETLKEILAAGPTERSDRATVANVNKAVKKAQGKEVADVPRRKLLAKVLELAREEKGDEASKAIAQVLDWTLNGKEPPKNSSLYALIHAEPDEGKIEDRKSA
jgi:ParB family chromosome partitioning protein